MWTARWHYLWLPKKQVCDGLSMQDHLPHTVIRLNLRNVSPCILTRFRYMPCRNLQASNTAVFSTNYMGLRPLYYVISTSLGRDRIQSRVMLQSFRCSFKQCF